MRHYRFPSGADESGGGAPGPLGHYVLRLDPGEELIQSLAQFALEQKVEAGYAVGLGSFDQVLLGYLDPETNEYVRRRFDERLEVAHMTGTFSMEGDRPHVHVHAVVAPRELLAYAGHVHEATVGAVMELFLTRFPGRLDRLPVAGQAFPGLFLPGEPPPDGAPQAK